MTKSEFDAFTREVFSRLDDMSRQMKEMLPREIYEVRQHQVIDDAQEVGQRVTATEKAITELSAQISTTRLATVNDTRSVERDVARTRYESLDRIYDLVKYFLATVGGAVLSYLVTRGH